MLKGKIHIYISIVFLTAILISLSFPSIRLNLYRAISLMMEADLVSLKQFLLSFGIWAPAISFTLMILQSLIPPIPASLLTMVNGFLFGPFWGSILSWVSALTAASLSFGLSRFFGRPLIEAIAGTESLTVADSFFNKHGKYAVLLARLIPVIPFDAVSYGAGLTAMSFWIFLGATSIGIIPAVIVCSVLGETFFQMGALGWLLLISFLLFSLFIWLRSYHREKIPRKGREI